MRPNRPIRLLKPSSPAPIKPSGLVASSLRQAIRLAMAKRHTALANRLAKQPDGLSDELIDIEVAKIPTLKDDSSASSNETDDQNQSEAILAKSNLLASTPEAQRVARAFLQDNHASLALRYLASHIGEFCSTLSADNEGPWEADLELNPAILAGTHLWIRLSRQALILRFECKDKTAHDLVWMGRSRLTAMLRPVLHAPCEIEIHVE